MALDGTPCPHVWRCTLTPDGRVHICQQCPIVEACGCFTRERYALMHARWAGTDALRKPKGPEVAAAG